MRIRTRYTSALEEEVARLRAENRALVNSILSVAGIPPMRATALARLADVPPASMGARLASPGRLRKIDRSAEIASKGRPYESATVTREDSLAAPLRHRSWQQIGRALEMQDALVARRERQTDTDTFPTPRKILIRP
ncbi:MAG: hypothetical protein WBD87_02800 [Candidatus Acidiferrales bacterium]